MTSLDPTVVDKLNEALSSGFGALFAFLVVATGIALVGVGGVGLARTRRHAH